MREGRGSLTRGPPSARAAPSSWPPPDRCESSAEGLFLADANGDRRLESAQANPGDLAASDTRLYWTVSNPDGEQVEGQVSRPERRSVARLGPGASHPTSRAGPRRLLGE